MVSQDAPKKIIRVDDPTLPVDETMEVNYPSNVRQVPTTRSAVNVPSPASRMVSPDQKYASSLQRMKELNEQTRREMEEAMMRKANQVETPPAFEIPPQQPQKVEPQPMQQIQSDLSQLISTGSIVEEVVIGGFKFKLHTLNAGENNEVLNSTFNTQNDIEKLGNLRIAVLARAIETVNGVPLEDVPGVDNRLPVIERREKLVKSLQLGLVVELFNAYTSMLERSEEVFKTASDNDETLKN